MKIQDSKKNTHGLFDRWRTWVVVGVFASVAALACSSNITAVRYDYEVDQAFFNDQLPASYHYYIYGEPHQAYILVGLQPGYTLSNPKWWEPVDTKQNSVAKLSEQVRSRYDHASYFGARIQDTSGKTVGVYYSGYQDAWAEVDPATRQVYMIVQSPWEKEPSEPMEHFRPET